MKPVSILHPGSIGWEAQQLFILGDKEWDRGRVKVAFRLMLKAANMGDLGAQLNVGYMYDTGSGVKRDLKKALYWYKRAYRRGDSCAASNIGTIWRDRMSFDRALYWFNRAIALSGGDDGNATLEIAKLYLFQRQDKVAAKSYLRAVLKSYYVTEDGKDEARTLLKQLSNRPKKRLARPRPAR